MPVERQRQFVHACARSADPTPPSPAYSTGPGPSPGNSGTSRSICPCPAASRSCCARTDGSSDNPAGPRSAFTAGCAALSNSLLKPAGTAGAIVFSTSSILPAFSSCATLRPDGGRTGQVDLHLVDEHRNLAQPGDDVGIRLVLRRVFRARSGLNSASPISSTYIVGLCR